MWDSLRSRSRRRRARPGLGARVHGADGRRAGPRPRRQQRRLRRRQRRAAGPLPYAAAERLAMCGARTRAGQRDGPLSPATRRPASHEPGVRGARLRAVVPRRAPVVGQEDQGVLAGHARRARLLEVLGAYAATRAHLRRRRSRRRGVQRRAWRSGRRRRPRVIGRRWASVAMRRLTIVGVAAPFIFPLRDMCGRPARPRRSRLRCGCRCRSKARVRRCQRWLRALDPRVDGGRTPEAGRNGRGRPMPRCARTPARWRRSHPDTKPDGARGSSALHQQTASACLWRWWCSRGALLLLLMAAVNVADLHAGAVPGAAT